MDANEIFEYEGKLIPAKNALQIALCTIGYRIDDMGDTWQLLDDEERAEFIELMDASVSIRKLLNTGDHR